MSYFKERNLVTVILLYIFTCGIYALYMFFQFGTEVRNQAIKEGTPTVPQTPLVALLLSMVTCGIYGLFYMYFMCKAVNEVCVKYEYPSMDPVLVFLLNYLFGIGVFLNIYYASEVTSRIAGNNTTQF